MRSAPVKPTGIGTSTTRPVGRDRHGKAALVNLHGRGRASHCCLEWPAYEHSWSLRLGEERELAKQLASRSDKAFCDLNSLFCFVRRGRVCGYVRIFQLVAAPAKVCERPEALSELGSDRAFNGVVTSAGSGAQALLGQESDAGEPCGVVGQDVSAVGIVAGHDGSCRCRLSCLGEQRGAV